MHKRITWLALAATLFFLPVVSPYVLAQMQPVSAALAAPQYVAGPGAGFYIENGYNQTPIDPDPISATGSFRFWDWKSLNPSPGVYDFGRLDGWIQAQLDAGYSKIGVAVMTYTGRFVACPIQGAELTPQWVRNGPDGIPGNADDPIVYASTPDTRDCDGDGDPDNRPWPLIDYQDDYYLSQYETFIAALGDHLRSGPYAQHIAWVAAGTGKDGENKPADYFSRGGVNYYDRNDLIDAGMDSAKWIQVVQRILTAYKNAFLSNDGRPQVQVLMQNAPFHKYPWERRDLADWAASLGIGVSINGIASDFIFIEACGSSNSSRNCAGLYDQARLHGEQIPIGLESYDYMMGTPNEFYWSMARALDVHADFIRLSHFWNTQDAPDNRVTAQWAAKYLGKGFQPAQPTPPSIWSRMREHKNPTYLSYAFLAKNQWHDWPTNGNYEFYLYQLHTAPNGVTIPITDDERFLSNGGITGWDAPESNVLDKPYHYNPNPYSQILNDAGLYNIDPGAINPVQIEVDPGWVARRSDQAGGNYGFFFDADDRYLSPPANPAQPHEVAITVTYLDVGNDRFKLMYDSTGGPKAARAYAVNDWTVSRGLAVSGGLPGDGIIDPPLYYVQKTNSKRWKVVTFLIEDGYFGNRLPGGADFYIDSRSDANINDGDEYIHHVDVQKLSDVPQITPTSTPTSQTPTPTGAPTFTPTPTPTATPATSGGAISGHVRSNTTGDGIPGVLVTLYSQSGSPILNVVTDNNGFYRMTGLAAGLYRVRPTPPSGWQMLTIERWVTVSAEQETTDIDFLAQPVDTPTPTLTPTPTITPTPTNTPTITPTPTPTGGRIIGVVWHDANRNQVRDDGEAPVADVTLQLKRVNGSLVAETTTNADGEYRFIGLAAETYQLLLITPANWEATTPTSVWLAPGTGQLESHFGIIPVATPTPTPTSFPSGGIRVFVWNDLNKDQAFQPGEPPLAGVTVIVRSWPGNQEWGRSQTGGDGYVLFDPLPAPATYRVEELDPPGMASSTPNELFAAISVGGELPLMFGDYETADAKLFMPQIWK